MIGGVCAAFLLAGCSTIGLEMAPRIYDLRAPQSIDVGGSRTSRQLLVAEPAAVRFYATDRIVVRDSAATLPISPAHPGRMRCRTCFRRALLRRWNVRVGRGQLVVRAKAY
jgi:uncharacterized lipoprotein YmbA